MWIFLSVKYEFSYFTTFTKDGSFPFSFTLKLGNLLVHYE